MVLTRGAVKRQNDGSQPYPSAKQLKKIVKSEITVKSDTETKFTKYVKLPAELRFHVLTYLQFGTLKNYAECSGYCNTEVQKFNTIAPVALCLLDTHDGVIVKLYYSANHGSLLLKKFVHLEHTNMVEDIKKFILKCYKYVKNTTTKATISMNKWPSEILSLELFSRIPNWRVMMFQPIHADIYQYFERSKTGIRNLWLQQFINQIFIPSDFFKAPFLKQLHSVDISAHCDIDVDDFITLQIPSLKIESSISYEAIRKKLERMIADTANKVRTIEIRLPTQFDLHELLPRDRFPNQFINEDRKLQIGSFEIKQLSYYGVFRLLKIIRI